MAGNLDWDSIWRSSNTSKDFLVRARDPFYSKSHTICSRQARWGHWQVSGRIKIITNTEILALTIARLCFHHFTYINTVIAPQQSYGEGSSTRQVRGRKSEKSRGRKGQEKCNAIQQLFMKCCPCFRECGNEQNKGGNKEKGVQAEKGGGGEGGMERRKGEMMKTREKPCTWQAGNGNRENLRG